MAEDDLAGAPPHGLRGEALDTLGTLGVAAAGAALAWLIGAPAYILTGPAAAVAAAAVAGLPMRLPDRVRDGAFLLVGVTIGTAVDPQAAAGLARWPLAIVAMALGVTVAMLLCRALLARRFGDDAVTATLAALPGHLSMVMSLGLSMQADVGRIAVVQSVRLLGLTLAAPAMAAMLGVSTTGLDFLPTAAPMGPGALLAVLAAAGALGWALARLRAPAPLLLGGLIASALAQVSGAVTGAPASWLALPAFIALGALIGQRFSAPARIPGALRRGVVAGLLTTVIAVACAAAAAWPVARLLDMPMAHVLIAFAPGGLETMVAMGAALGADPGFVAACHVGRLLWLGLLLPVMLRLAVRRGG